MLIVGAVPFLLMGQKASIAYAQAWGRVSIFLARVLAGIRLEVRGQEHLPAGGSIVAAKHQSAMETFALLPSLTFPTFVVKRELVWIPLFGLYTIASGMILVRRGGGAAALRSLVERSRQEIVKQRPILIFPEGTRRPPGAPGKYHYGVARLYKSLDVPAVPVALNTGVFWPRRKFLRYPGTAVIEFLAPIQPGLDAKDFLDELETRIESASDRLLVEAAQAPDAPPIPSAVLGRLAGGGG
ncbi:MAG: 1-acyl-sn-glycerol-3-phosphate acyltransferase [Hyphomicrobiales bacterium]|nr:1-acyl-sn-glycerol-3-phosphate acyltransferase [Hyphomicrobiales bacterium]